MTLNDKYGICKICKLCKYIMNMLPSVKYDTIKGPHLPIISGNKKHFTLSPSAAQSCLLCYCMSQKGRIHFKRMC